MLRLLGLLGRVALAGPPRDERRSRHLDEGIFELKTPRGFRLVYFFETTATHRVQRTVQKAKTARAPRDRPTWTASPRRLPRRLGGRRHPCRDRSMMTPTFDEHTTLAQEHPAYWSYLMTLELIDALVAEMDAKGVSGAELARRMGTSRAWVSRVLAGECNLTAATMGKLAFALGMRVTTRSCRLMTWLPHAAGGGTSALGSEYASAHRRGSRRRRAPGRLAVASALQTSTCHLHHPGMLPPKVPPRRQEAMVLPK